MKLVLVDFAAGYFAGACGALVGHPFDTIKTWQQASNISIRKAMRDIYVFHRGFNGFYRGLLTPILLCGIQNSVFFGVYGNVMRAMQTDNSNANDNQRMFPKQSVFVAGSIAGLIQTAVACPIELIKIRLQRGSCGTLNPWHCTQRILEKEGLRGMWRGMTPTILRDFIPCGLYMVLYEKILHFMLEGSFIYEKNFGKHDETEIKSIIPIVAGSIAGVASWTISAPFDTVKTIMQAEPNPLRYKNMWDCIQQNVESYGLKLFSRGFVMLLTRAIPVNSAIFLGYELYFLLCRSFSIQNTRRDE